MYYKLGSLNKFTITECCSRCILISIAARPMLDVFIYLFIDQRSLTVHISCESVLRFLMEMPEDWDVTNEELVDLHGNFHLDLFFSQLLPLYPSLRFPLFILVHLPLEFLACCLMGYPVTLKERFFIRFKKIVNIGHSWINLCITP